MKEFHMEKIKSFALQKPILFSIPVILLATVLTEIPLQNLLAPYLGDKAAFYTMIILEQGLTGLLLFMLLARFGWLEAAGFTHPKKWRTLWLGWPLLVFTILNLSDFLEGIQTVDTAKPLLILFNLLAALSTGWIEQILGRGIVLVPLLYKWGRTRAGIYLAVLVSGVIFGILHLMNFLAGRLPLINTLTQIIFAVFFGIIFAACMLRNRTIWPMIFLHAAVDWGANLEEISVGGGLHTTVAPLTAGNALVTILITLPLALYGLFILRKVTPAEVLPSPPETPKP
jgi:membrane protease YdiL (CAAX protease family)